MVTLPQSYTTIEPMAIEKLILPFGKDYFMYWGSVSSATCKHRILWIGCRTPLGISAAQVGKSCHSWQVSIAFAKRQENFK